MNDIILPGNVYASQFPYSWKSYVGSVSGILGQMTPTVQTQFMNQEDLVLEQGGTYALHVVMSGVAERTSYRDYVSREDMVVKASWVTSGGIEIMDIAYFNVPYNNYAQESFELASLGFPARLKFEVVDYGALGVNNTKNDARDVYLFTHTIIIQRTMGVGSIPTDGQYLYASEAIDLNGGSLVGNYALLGGLGSYAEYHTISRIDANRILLIGSGPSTTYGITLYGMKGDGTQIFLASGELNSATKLVSFIMNTGVISEHMLIRVVVESGIDLVLQGIAITEPTEQFENRYAANPLIAYSGAKIFDDEEAGGFVMEGFENKL